MRTTSTTITTTALLAALAATTATTLTPKAQAIRPQSFEHGTQADFKNGATEGTLVNNLGQIKLSPSETELGQFPKEVTSIYQAFEHRNGQLFLTANGGLLLTPAHTSGHASETDSTDAPMMQTLVTVDDGELFAIGQWQDHLLVAISGQTPRLAVLKQNTKQDDDSTQADQTELITVAYLTAEQTGEQSEQQADKDPGQDSPLYLWDLNVDGNLITIATGTPAKLYQVDLSSLENNLPEHTSDSDTSEQDDSVLPTPKLIFEAEQNNILCLASDGDTLYAGTDTDGLIYKLTPNKTSETGYHPSVAFDAAEPEIGALLVVDHQVYAGTSDAKQARTGSLTKANEEETGRPAATTSSDDTAPESSDSASEDNPITGGAPEGGAQPEEPDLPPTPEDITESQTAGASNAPGASIASQTSEANTESKANPDASEQVAETAEASEVQGDAAVSTDSPNASPETAPEAKPKPPVVTQAQRDRLREVIRQKLLQARKTGNVGSIASSRSSSARKPSAPRARSARPASQEAKSGNAVYRIDQEGFVSEVFRESVMVLDLAMNPAGELVIATGNEGQIYQLDIDLGQEAVLADLNAKQITALIASTVGELADSSSTQNASHQNASQLLAASANGPGLTLITQEPDADGQFTSMPLDCGQIALFGSFTLNAELPEGTSVLLETRSGNIADPEGLGWSAWSTAQAFVGDERPAIIPRQATISSPPARYLQYRLTLVGDGQISPVVEKVQAHYVVPNQAPKISSVQATYDKPQDMRPEANDLPEINTELKIEWEASDDNQDRLLFDVAFQPAGSTRWIDAGTKITENQWAWDTRKVPDGRYLLKVTATDSPDNPSNMALSSARQSAPVVVDNTPPVIEATQVTSAAAATTTTTATTTATTITGSVHDAVLPVTHLAYAINSADEYQILLPDDLILDSTHETFTVTLPDLPNGPHVVTFRATDARGNASYHQVLLD